MICIMHKCMGGNLKRLSATSFKSEKTSIPTRFITYSVFFHLILHSHTKMTVYFIKNALFLPLYAFSPHVFLYPYHYHFSFESRKRDSRICRVGRSVIFVLPIIMDITKNEKMAHLKAQKSGHRYVTGHY